MFRIKCCVASLSFAICMVMSGNVQADVWDEYEQGAADLANSFGQEVSDYPSESTLAELAAMFGEDAIDSALEWNKAGHGIFISLWWGSQGHWISWTNAHHHTAFTQRWENRGHNLTWTRDSHNTDTSRQWNDQGHVYADSRRGVRPEVGTIDTAVDGTGDAGTTSSARSSWEP